MTADNNGYTLGRAIAHYGFVMSHLVDEKIRQTGREDEIQGLLARGFRFLFTFVPQDGSDGCCGEVGASLYNPNTRQTVPIFSLNLVEDMMPNAVRSRFQ